VEAFPGGYALLSISDNGIGMSKDTAERIFDPFFTTKDLGKGTGLGLSMVYGIVKNHDGHIICTSEPGAGTSFKIYFPILQKDKSALPQKQEKSIMKGGSETILLVEDEDPIRQLGITILQRFGYTVLSAPNGEEALNIYQAKREHISLIILDLIMPGMGGQKCFEEIMKIDPRQKIVIATGHLENGSMNEFLQKGVKGYINKPYRMDQMLTVVRDVLDQE
jgi:CheY-like chemotaxis protein